MPDKHLKLPGQLEAPMSPPKFRTITSNISSSLHGAPVARESVISDVQSNKRRDKRKESFLQSGLLRDPRFFLEQIKKNIADRKAKQEEDKLYTNTNNEKPVPKISLE